MGIDLSRRTFLHATASAGAALVIGVDLHGAMAAGSPETVFNPFVRIGADGVVTVILKHFEMGQGTSTGLTTLVAEELDADWGQMAIDFAPADQKKYANLFFGAQGTGGSTAIANSFVQYRQAGAVARDMLARAAAAAWKIPADRIQITQGRISAGNHQGHFGDFAAAAARLAPPEKPVLKTPEQFTLIGRTTLARKDNADKTDGSAIFAQDIKRPGMLVAALVRPPKFGAVVTGFDQSAAAKIAGFVTAQVLPNKAAVAVFAKNTWAAFKARDAIVAQWDFAHAETRSSAQIADALRAAAQSPALDVANGTKREAIGAAIATAAKRIEAEFYFPFLAHAPMEPLNCVIEAKGDGVLIHDGCQFPATAQPVIAHVLGLKPEQVEIKTLYAGGSFGRRATPNADYHAEAAMAFALLGRKVPVKLVWSREDDIRGGYYRSAAVHLASIGLDEAGAIVGWDHRLSAKSILKGTLFEKAMVHDGVDETSVEGVKGSLYALPEMVIGLTDFETPVPVLWWRSVGHTHTAFVMESLIDMIAVESRRDPVALRLSLLNENTPDPRQARMIAVIKAARDSSGWGRPLPAGRVQGFASHISFNTYVATVAEISVEDDKVRVHKLTMAVDCGVAVNPDVIKAQMEGGAGFALGTIMRNEITLDQGEVEQSNFPDYAPLRLAEMPEIAVHIVASAEAPSGVGEPGVPPVGPALANALFAATGKRVTRLPLSSAGFILV